MAENLPAEVAGEKPKRKRLTKDEKKAIRLALAKREVTAQSIHEAIPSISLRMARMILDDPHWIDTMQKKQKRRIQLRYNKEIPTKLLKIAKKSEDGKEVAAVSKELRNYLEIGVEATAKKERAKGKQSGAMNIFQMIIQQAGAPKEVKEIVEAKFPGIDE